MAEVIICPLTYHGTSCCYSTRNDRPVSPQPALPRSHLSFRHTCRDAYQNKHDSRHIPKGEWGDTVEPPIIKGLSELRTQYKNLYIKHNFFASILINVVYTCEFCSNMCCLQVLSLSQAAIRNISIGHVVNLASNDVQRFDLVSILGQYLSFLNHSPNNYRHFDVFLTSTLLPFTLLL